MWVDVEVVPGVLWQHGQAEDVLLHGRQVTTLALFHIRKDERGGSASVVASPLQTGTRNTDIVVYKKISPYI